MAKFPETDEEPIEVYRSMSAAALEAMGVTESAVTPFTIEVRFLGGLTPSQTSAFKTAADRWSRVIVGDLPSVKVDGEMIDDLVIFAKGEPIDGRSGVLGRAGSKKLRPRKAGAAAFLPATGEMSFDTADLAAMEERGTLVDVITHEMGHVLGIGRRLWEKKKLLKDLGSSNPTFRGPRAMQEFGVLQGTGPTPVPVENTGGQGTAGAHWRESVFRAEMMSGFISAGGNPISRMTVASLADLGYQVDLDAADPYSLPGPLEAAEAPVGPESNIGEAMEPIEPDVLPDESID